MSSIWGFFILYVALFVLASLVMSGLGLDVISAFSSVAACIGNGVLYFGGRLLDVGLGNPMAQGFSYGNTFLVTAGLMNLLTVLDVSDIARGLKE